MSDKLKMRALEWLRNEAKFGTEARYAAVVLQLLELQTQRQGTRLTGTQMEAKATTPPEGVPTEPTPDMCAAGGAVVLDHILFDRGADGELDPHGKARVGMDNAAKVYAAMVKARSSPQKEIENGSM